MESFDYGCEGCGQEAVGFSEEGCALCEECFSEYLFYELEGDDEDEL